MTEPVQIYLLGPLNGPRIQPTGSAIPTMKRGEASMTTNGTSAGEQLRSTLKLSENATKEQIAGAALLRLYENFSKDVATAIGMEGEKALPAILSGLKKRLAAAPIRLSGSTDVAYALQQNATSEAQRIRDFQTVQDHKKWREGFDDSFSDQEVAEFKAYLDAAGL